MVVTVVLKPPVPRVVGVRTVVDRDSVVTVTTFCSVPLVTWVGDDGHPYECLPRVSEHGWSWGGDTIVVVLTLVHVSTITVGVGRHDGTSTTLVGVPSVVGSWVIVGRCRLLVRRMVKRRR